MRNGWNYMAKTKYGKVELSEEDFKDENALIRISMMIPMSLYKDLKALSLNEKYSGKYQVLIRDVLMKYAEQSKPKKKSAG